MPAFVKLDADWKPVGAGTAVTPTPETPPAAPVGALTLMHNAADLNEMRSRRVSGPFHTTGNGAPWGDWTRVVANKDSFMANPFASRWAGPTSINPSGQVVFSYVDSSGQLGYTPPITQMAHIQNAAFYAWVNPGAADALTVAQKVRDVLVGQVNYTDTVFSNRLRWTLDSGESKDKSDVRPCWALGPWMSKLILTYDYICAYETEKGITLFTAAQHTSIRDWHLAYADWALPRDDRQYNPMFDNRDTYTLSASGKSVSTGFNRYRDASGVRPAPWLVGYRLNNRAINSTRYLALVAARFADAPNAAAYRLATTRWLGSFLRFGVYPDQTVAEFERCRTVDSAQGVKYGCELVGSLLTAAMAWQNYLGDNSLFLMSTTDGYSDTTNGTFAKSLQSVSLALHRHTDDTYLRYVGSGGTVGNEAHRIKMGANDNRWHDGMLIMLEKHLRETGQTADANLHRDYYMRYKTGQAAMPNPPQQSQGDPRGGEWGVHCGVLFEFGRI